MNKDFLWGSATASYQCEGAWNLDDKVESMWDVYLHENNLENGDNASDFYHHFEEDLITVKKWRTKRLSYVSCLASNY